MQLQARLVHAESGRRVVEVSAHRNGELLGAQSVNGGIQRRRVEVRDGDWFSVIIRDPAGQATVLSNAIYVRSK